ncbi:MULTISPECIES: MerR family transcriptional regulator [Microbacteriaceae]|uniref:MerR family transcriptional regulator n=1 Tax=Rathayibacter festucae TaxID=110937 RepID=A0ABX6H5F0_9MICO|nr:MULTISPECIES: MerR family transcriptional regulator [Microbacteriaceae]MCJ1709371.1 MerR family transcriptional regulator [Microbacterium sp. VKM Ac-2923]QHC65021.1 MerR family transcriptional regulator [Rathayibacter festucae]
MRISDVSKRSGVSATALRYYESIGLITPGRSSNGYRDYDADVLARLDLIESSKELGLPLEDIGRHLRALETTSCTDVRDALRPLLAERVRQLDEKRARLDELRSRLDRADHDLAECPDRDELCSTECIFRSRGQHQ